MVWLEIKDALVDVLPYILPLRKRHLSWVKYQMVSPYLTTDALDAQSTSGNEVCTHLKHYEQSSRKL